MLEAYIYEYLETAFLALIRMHRSPWSWGCGVGKFAVWLVVGML